MNTVREQYFTQASTPRVVETVEYTTMNNFGGGNMGGVYGNVNQAVQPEISTRKYVVENQLIPQYNSRVTGGEMGYNSQIRQNINYTSLNGYQTGNQMMMQGASQFGTQMGNQVQQQIHSPVIETHRAFNQYPLAPQTPFTNSTIPLIHPPQSSCCCYPDLCGSCCSLESCFLCGCCPCVSPTIPKPIIQSNQYGTNGVYPTPIVGGNGITGGIGVNQYGTYQKSCCFCPQCSSRIGCGACCQPGACCIPCCDCY